MPSIVVTNGERTAGSMSIIDVNRNAKRNTLNIIFRYYNVSAGSHSRSVSIWSHRLVFYEKHIAEHICVISLSPCSMQHNLRSDVHFKAAYSHAAEGQVDWRASSCCQNMRLTNICVFHSNWTNLKPKALLKTCIFLSKTTFAVFVLIKW